MALYASETIIVGPIDLSPDADTVSGSLAKEVNDAIETLDSTTHPILAISISKTGQRAWVLIVGGT